MNTFMWDSPFTARHLAGLQALGVSIIPPVRPFAPRMPACMYSIRVTVQLLPCWRLVMQECVVLEQVSKKLACGDIGDGALAAPEVIAESVHKAVAPSRC